MKIELEQRIAALFFSSTYSDLESLKFELK